jgi:hypothetical protein
MALSLYEFTVPVYFGLLKSLSETLDKASAFAVERKIEPSVFINDRLYHDMWPLHRQVASVCNHAIRGTYRLAGLEVPPLSGGEASFDDLKARIAQATELLRKLDRQQFVDADTREIVFPSGDTQRRMSGRDYLLTFSLPNLYFHLSMAYAILRHNGVPLVKDDFLPG